MACLNATKPHSASLSNYANDRATSKKVFEILCPWIRGKLKNAEVCGLLLFRPM